MSVDIMKLVEWLRGEIPPTPDELGHDAFRCSARLRDGLYLPCVLFRDLRAHVRFVLSRLEESQASGITDPTNLKPGYYPSVVERFVARGNSLSIWDVQEVDVSPYAIPAERLREIRGETAMSWTAFVATMDDGAEFSFGTTRQTDFFEMPPGYSASQMTRITPHRSRTEPIYGPKPFFECFLDNVEFGQYEDAATPPP